MELDYEKRLLRLQNGDLQVSSNMKYKPDRFIPLRSKAIWNINFDKDESSPTDSDKLAADMQAGNKMIYSSKSNTKASIYSYLLKNELIGCNYVNGSTCPRKVNESSEPLRESLFHFSSSKLSPNKISPYSLSPINDNSLKLLSSYQKPHKSISRMPYKVLDVPDIGDNFYLNILDWSSSNIIAIGLTSSVYLYNVDTTRVTKLLDASSRNDVVTSVCWFKGNVLSVGFESGVIQLWDVENLKEIASERDHSNRIGVLASNNTLLCSGSKDMTIKMRDPRIPSAISTLLVHKNEVCGLKWSWDDLCFASGGNDNNLFVFDSRYKDPIFNFTDHRAAVKAISWCPYQHGVLASGGGSEDKSIKIRDILIGRMLQSVKTGSQICGLAWSKYSNEIVSCHGYSLNQIVLWNGEPLRPITQLKGHTQRILYMAASPEGSNIATAAGDETLRFWKVFSKQAPLKGENSKLDIFNKIR